MRHITLTFFLFFLFLIETLRVPNETDVQVLVLVCIRCGLRWVVMSFGGDMISISSQALSGASQAQVRRKS